MGFDKVVLVPFAFTLAERYPIICAIEGSIHCTSSIVTIAAPSMMAASRYYTVIRGLQSTSTNPFIEAVFFTKTGVLSLIAGSWVVLSVMYGTLTGFDQMGMSIHGFCAFLSLSQCSLSGCPAEWRSPLLWPVFALRLWVMIDATGENHPGCREGLSLVYSQLSYYQFLDPQRDEHLGWVRGHPQWELNPRP
uniref:NADH:ubiquinone reductase (H(+)-translocating) n=1 Tax=Plectus sambesii TaxID=2011161 RepID=A0A914WBZ6_9BILA